jgi:hypothetical protein
MKHALHIACKHFMKSVAPASPCAIHKKVKEALKRASLDGDLDLDQLDDELVGLGLGPNNGNNDEGDNDDDMEFLAGDALRKALALVKQVFI